MNLDRKVPESDMPGSKTDTQFFVKKTGRKKAAVALQGPLLIVDDNADDAKLGKRAFERLNSQFTAVVLASGRELIAHFQGALASSKPAVLSVPSAILLDLRMPEMDGFEVMEWLSKQPQYANIPVIVLSNFDDLHHLKRAYALGARSYLLKPIDVESLRNAFSSLGISV